MITTIEGVYHVAPHEHGRNGIVAAELAHLLYAPATLAGLRSGGSFNLGTPDDYRVPDLGFHDADQLPDLYYEAAPLVVEVLSPGDETYATFDFYGRHRVAEIRSSTRWPTPSPSGIEQPTRVATSRAAKAPSSG